MASTVPDSALDQLAEEFAAKYLAHTLRLVRAALKVARRSSEEAKRDEVFRTWARAKTAGFEHWKEDYGGQPVRVRLNPLFDPLLTRRNKDAAEHAYEFKLIRSKSDTDKWIDRSFLNAALKELNLENCWPVAPGRRRALRMH